MGRTTYSQGDVGLAELRGYWEALRDGPAPPLRARIDPRGIAGILEQAVMLERVAPGVARIRLAGMAVNDLMGMEIRGMPLTAMFAPASIGRVSDGLEALFAGPAILDAEIEAERGFGRPRLEARLMLLPICSLPGICDLALGAFAFRGEPGRPPRRFMVSRLLREPLMAASPLRRPLAVPMPAGHAPRLADPGRPRPHLRLVTSEG